MGEGILYRHCVIGNNRPQCTGESETLKKPFELCKGIRGEIRRLFRKKKTILNTSYEILLGENELT